MNSGVCYRFLLAFFGDIAYSVQDCESDTAVACQRSAKRVPSNTGGIASDGICPAIAAVFG